MLKCVLLLKFKFVNICISETLERELAPLDGLLEFLSLSLSLSHSLSLSVSLFVSLCHLFCISSFLHYSNSLKGNIAKRISIFGKMSKTSK